MRNTDASLISNSGYRRVGLLAVLGATGSLLLAVGTAGADTVPGCTVARPDAYIGAGEKDDVDGCGDCIDAVRPFVEAGFTHVALAQVER